MQGEALTAADLSVEPDAFTSGLFKGVGTALHKIASHEVTALGLLASASAALHRESVTAQGTRAAASARLAAPPFRVVLTTIVDVAGFRISAMAIPPVEENSTLVYGKLDAAGPFVQRSADLGGVLRRVGKLLNLKPHAVELLADAPVTTASTVAGGAGAVAIPPSRRTLVIPLGVEIQVCRNHRVRVIYVR